jgi:hypothetical protein
MTLQKEYATGSSEPKKEYVTEPVPEKKPAEVIDLFRNSPSTENRGSARYHPNIDSQIQPQIQPELRIQNEYHLSSIDKASKKGLEEAFELITNATDKNLTRSERSNCFDDWQNLLRSLNRVEGNFSRHHSRILGTLLSAVNKKDISDFEDNVLIIFRNITYTLRQPRISKVETQRSIKDILKSGTRISLPLGVDDLSEEAKQPIELVLLNLLKQSQME